MLAAGDIGLYAKVCMGLYVEFSNKKNSCNSGAPPRTIDNAQYVVLLDVSDLF
jgi:hypothetical protein